MLRQYQTIPDILESYPGSVLFLLRSKDLEIVWYHRAQLAPEGEFELMEAVQDEGAT